MTEVRLEGVTKKFGDVNAISDVNLQVPDGSFVILLGPTGAGKTTTLRLVAGLENPDSGDVFIGDRCVTSESPAERNVAMVFQQYSLYPHLTVKQNLEFPLKSPQLRTPAHEIDTRVKSVAETLHIDHKLSNKATELSGGEMQRVSIGRALVREPEIFLMDEPLSSLDAKLRSELRLELKRLQSDLGATLLYVTHDQIEAMTMATHIGVLDEGRLVQFGSPREIYEQPETLYVASRLGLPRINTLPAETFGGSTGEASVIGLRPEHIHLAKQSNAVPDAHFQSREARVIKLESLGDQTRLHMNIQDSSLVTLIEHSEIEHYQEGTEIHVTPVQPLFFTKDGKRLSEN